MQSRLTLRAAWRNSSNKKKRWASSWAVDLSWSVPLHSFLYNGAYAKTYYQRPNIRMTARYLSAFCETPHAACPTLP